MGPSALHPRGLGQSIVGEPRKWGAALLFWTVSVPMRTTASGKNLWRLANRKSLFIVVMSAPTSWDRGDGDGDRGRALLGDGSGPDSIESRAGQNSILANQAIRRYRHSINTASNFLAIARVAAGAFGFLTLIHVLDGPERYGGSEYTRHT